jgi:cytochrome c biogenesis protein CcmG/thiol:disulfide interchange protein DsbE
LLTDSFSRCITLARQLRIKVEDNPMPTRFVPRLLVLALLAIPAFASGVDATGREPRPAPGFTLKSTTGTVTLDSLRGKVVLVDFWASWCQPCHKSFPWLSAMHEKYASKGLRIVAIDVDKNRDDADEFLARHPAPFTVAFDHAGKTAAAFQVSGMPSTFLIDSTGSIVHTHVGFDPRKADQLENLIKEALRP